MTFEQRLDRIQRTIYKLELDLLKSEALMNLVTINYIDRSKFGKKIHTELTR